MEIVRLIGYRRECIAYLPETYYLCGKEKPKPSEPNQTMTRKANNNQLHQAKQSKSDEFYTQYSDIARELAYYEAYLAGKTIYCNADDPSTSQFVRYFLDHFERLHINKLIASCYRPNGKGAYAIYTQPSPPQSAIATLLGNGDFRSEECVEFLKTADVVITNPPFSLFREWISQLTSYQKQFLLIGNINAITYKEIFALIQANQAWLGVHLGRGISGFIVPERYQLYGTEARIDEHGNHIVSTNNCLWLTNLECPTRQEELSLTKTYQGNEDNYPTYDNCAGINVNRTQDIPMDYPGLMGVPITFLHKYNPAQFEIVRFRKGDDGKDLRINGKSPYFRILIRRRHKC